MKQGAKRIIVLYGPTAVGKTELSIKIAHQVKGEIINADLGQFYVPFTIGTAKPDWKSSPIQHHLFDILNKPVDFDVYQYRQQIHHSVLALFARNKVPIIVGGSGFYISSLFFLPGMRMFQSRDATLQKNALNLWEQLKKIDPVRAAQIHPHDIYRLKRALSIWYETGQLPSAQLPLYAPIAPYILFILTRDRTELYERINQRVIQMFDEGWIQEVEKIKDTAWVPFIKRKKLIGYPEIIDYIMQKKNENFLQIVIDAIAQKTRNYAKRQEIFGRMLVKKLAPYEDIGIGKTQVVNLTLSGNDLYINHL